MAEKDLEIRVKTDSSEVDNLRTKLDDIKKLYEGSPISIKYDIDGKPLDVVFDKEVSLRNQTKLLWKELQILQEQGKANSKEFALVSERYNDVKDKMQLVDARSRDLFASLALIPGPIGDIAGKLNGAIGLLKTFSGFKLTDFKNQLKGLFNDLEDIVNGFYGIEKSSKVATTSIENKTNAITDDTDATETNTSATDDATAATNAGTAANLKQTEAIVKQDASKRTSLSVSEKRLEAQIKVNEATKAEIEFMSQAKNAEQAIVDVMKVGNVTRGQATAAYEAMMKDKEKELELGLQRERQLERNVIHENNMIEARKKEGQIIANLNEAQKEQLKIRTEGLVGEERAAATTKFLTEVQKENTAATATNTVAKETNTAATKAYTVGVETATFATRAFSLALKSIGIGFVIAGVAFLVDKLIDLGKNLFKTDEKLKQLKDSTLKGAEALETAKNTVTEVQIAFEQASKGVITKKKALDIYNEKLGNTIGQAKTIEEAESLFNANTANYVKSVGLRAEAQTLFSLAAAKAAEASQMEVKGYWDWFFDTEHKLFESREGQLNRLRTKVGKDAAEFRAKGEALLKEALGLETKFKPKEDKKDGKTDDKDDAYNRRLKELDALIQLEIDKNNTDKTLLEKHLQDRFDLVVKHEKFTNAEKELLRKQDAKKVDDALNEDAKRQLDSLKQLEDIRIAAIADEQQREEETRANKLYFDKIALSADKEFQLKSKEEIDETMKNLEIQYQEDLVKIREKYFLKKFEETNKENAFQLDQLKQRNENAKNANEIYIDEDATVFGKALFQTKKFLQDKFIDMKGAYEMEHHLQALELQRQNDELDKAYQQKKLTDEQYKTAKAQLNSEIAANDQQLVNRQMELDKIMVEAKQATAEATMQIAENAADLIAALGQFSTEAQIASAIADAGIGIAKIIISTNVAIAEFAASVAPLGPAGVAMASAYAIKQKIAAGLGIAAITVNAIGRINQIKNQGQNKGGADQFNRGKNYGDGGMINGPSHNSPEGGVPIMAEGGEAVMTRRAVTMFRPLLSMMNQAGGGTAFTGGAMSQAPYDAPKTEDLDTPIIKTYVVENELTSIQERQARLRSLSTL